MVLLGSIDKKNKNIRYSLFRMFKALNKTVQNTLNPAFLFISALFIVYQAALYLVFFEFFDLVPKFFYDTFVLANNLNASFFDAAFAFAVANFDALIVLAVLSILWIAGYVWLLFCFTKIKHEKIPMINALVMTGKYITRIIGLSFFYWILVLLFALIGLFIVFVGVFLGGLELLFYLLFLIWLVIGTVLYLKLIFLPIIFFSEDKKIRESIRETNEWGKKKLLHVVLIMLITSVVSTVIGEAAIFLSELTSIELVSIIIFFLALTVTSSFSGLFLTNYYFLTK